MDIWGAGAKRVTVTVFEAGQAGSVALIGSAAPYSLRFKLGTLGADWPVDGDAVEIIGGLPAAQSFGLVQLQDGTGRIVVTDGRTLVYQSSDMGRTWEQI